MGILFPSNTLYFFGFINDIASFNLIPTDNINNSILEFDEFTDYNTYNPYFGLMNYTSMNIILNLGIMFYALQIYIFFILLARFLQNFTFKK